MLRESVPPPASIVPREPLMRLLQHSMLVTSMPLNTKLLLVVRAPFTLGEIDALSFDSSSLMSAETPGSMASSCVMFRAEVGQRFELFPIERPRDGGRVGRNHPRVGVHRHRLGDVADLQHHINVANWPVVTTHAFAPERLEARRART